MSEIRRTNQGGSTILVVIIGVILALSLISGAYLLKQRGDQARRDQAIAIVNQQSADESAKKSDATATTASNNSNSANNSSNSATTTTKTTTKGAKGEDLPVTGPESSAFELIGVGVITAFMVSYLRSRRTLSRYL